VREHDISAHSTVGEGLVDGVAGGLLAAAWFVATGLISGDPLQIPNLLGRLLFSSEPITDGVLRGDAVLAFVAAHFGFFAALGATLALVAHLAERTVAIRVALLTGGALLLAVLAWFTAAVPALTGYAVSFWMLFLGVLLGVGVVAILAWRRHDAFRDGFGGAPSGDAERRAPPAASGGRNV
jgi:hypothetical protein